MRRNHFELEGYSYYQEERRCKRPCKTCDEGDGHIYWYRSIKRTGVREYVGKNLPDEIIQVRERLQATDATIRTHIQNLKRDTYILRKLSEREGLSREEKARLDQLGYSHCMTNS